MLLRFFFLFFSFRRRRRFLLLHGIPLRLCLLFLLVFGSGVGAFIRDRLLNNNFLQSNQHANDSLTDIENAANNQQNANKQKLSPSKSSPFLLSNSLNNSNQNLLLPSYFSQYGKLGFNFDLDLRNGTVANGRARPFIYCRRYNKISCSSSNPSDCTETVRCPATADSHLLGCMAVSIYNVSENGSAVLDEQPDLQGCWVHSESELRECLAEKECVVDTRGTGNIERSAKFCCCRSHECNAKFTFLTDTNLRGELAELDATRGEAASTPSPPLFFPQFMDNWIFLSILLSLLSIVLAASLFLLSQAFRRNLAKKGIKQIRPLSGANSKEPLIGGEVSLMDGTKVRLAEIHYEEKISEGRFGKVFKARVGDRFVAVKQFDMKGEDSWTNEIDIHSMKAIAGNEFIAKFLGGFHSKSNNKYLILLKFYSNCSLCDYLRANTLNLLYSVRMISSMLNGLAFLHEEVIYGPDAKPTIVHRDFKSKNILVRDDLNTCITDFGLALKCETSKCISPEQNIMQVGTRRYMSPEVLEGATEFSSFAFQQIDVYAAALVIWEVLSRTYLDSEEEEHSNTDGKENNKNDADGEGEVETTSTFSSSSQQQQQLSPPLPSPLLPRHSSKSLPPFMLPYEAELGPNPSIGKIRDLVAARKCRPRVRAALMHNELAASIVRTMSEMWDHESDGRITSSCARDRSRFWLAEVT